tara:strand:- start:67 stop:270 length:204 start_codon:yes stop_codon:yes gene_type:complete
MSYSLYITGTDEFIAAFRAAIDKCDTIEQVQHMAKMNADEIRTMDAQVQQILRTCVSNRKHYLGYRP